MAYERINWENAPSTDTPLNADNLNAMDNAIASVSDNVDSLTKKTNDLQDGIDLANARMDTLVAVPPGSTTENTELLDIRLGADGTTYTSAGAAVRGQIGDLNNAVDAVEDDIDDVLAMIAPVFSPGVYNKGDLVRYENDLYECISKTTSGAAWDSTKWSSIDAAHLIRYLHDYIAFPYASGSGTQLYAKGALCFYDHKLYRALEALSVTSSTPFDDTKWERVLVGSILTELSEDSEDLNEKITDLKADLNNLVEELDFVDYGDVYGWVVGVLNNGEVNTSVTTWKTIDGYIQINPGMTIRLSNVDSSLRFSLAYAYYDSTYTFTNGDIINPTGHYDFTNNTENTVYLRVSASKLHVDNKAIKIYFTVNMLTRLTSLENNVTGLTGNVSTLNNDVLEIKESVSNLSDVVGVQTPIADYGYEEDTLLKNDGGTRSNTSYNTTSYIDVTDKRLVLSMSASIAYTFLLCFYDSEQSYITDTFNTYNITGEFEIVPPSNAKYVRLSVSKTNYPRVSLINKNGLYPKVDELTEQIPENNIYNYSGSNIREILSACYIENSGLVYPQVASGYTKQAIAYYDGVLFQFLADDACTIIDTTTNTLIGTVTADTGHSNTASFSNEFYASGDRFPLCYVGATIDSTNIVKVLRFTNEFTVELIRTLTLPYETFGYSASIAFDRLTNKYYSLANKVSSSGGHISTCVLCELSVDNMTEVSTDVYAPTLVSKKEVNLPAGEVYYQQGFKVINGVFFLASGGASATSKAFILVISYSEGEIINVFNSFPSVIANSEFEDMVFIANTFIATYNIVLHVRDKGYYKFIL